MLMPMVRLLLLCVLFVRFSFRLFGSCLFVVWLPLLLVCGVVVVVCMGCLLSVCLALAFDFYCLSCLFCRLFVCLFGGLFLLLCVVVVGGGGGVGGVVVVVVVVAVAVAVVVVVVDGVGVVVVVVVFIVWPAQS